MAYLRGFGSYLPTRVVDNSELAPLVGVDSDWILRVAGIRERRFAAPEETVASLGAQAARDCLEACSVQAEDVGLILVSSGSADRRFPGPAAAIGSSLGIAGVPAIDLPIASAGSLFGVALAADLCRRYGNVLVIGTEVMSRVIRIEPQNRDTAILFGDGAGACLISADTGFAEISDSLLQTDGEFADALRLDFDSGLRMDGRTIILQVSRKLPRAISELLDRNHCTPEQVGAFLLHQANLNLLTRVAQALSVPEDRIFRNVDRYGNTSSASLLIAAAEWLRSRTGPLTQPIVLGAFGAGLNWGAILLTGREPNP
jgi:3-oxoacyl-[acyl-carrier-protein] synthase-3